MTPKWIQTYTGKKFDFNNFTIKNIDIIDIAHSLGNICRFNGHCNKFYSVAEHSIYVSRNCSDDLKLWGLLDDAAETYIGDLVRPIKQYMYDFQELEIDIMDMIILKFGLYPDIRPDKVIEIDNRVLVTERNQIMKITPDDWGLNEYESFDFDIECWSSEIAEKNFLNEYYRLINAK